MSYDRKIWRSVRNILQGLFNGTDNSLKENEELKKQVLIPQSDVVMVMPANIGDYTDFYSSKEHATNLGKMFRPNEPPLMDNWLYIPIGYHGRASSVVVSNTKIKRPSGQVKPPTSNAPFVSSSKKLDYELEMALFVGKGNNLGEPITMENAEEYMFGVVLMNDWSARDIQPWEYRPLGPFTAKNFATTISPWIVTMDALEPFRVSPPKQDPEPLDYLKENTPGGYNINLEVKIKSEKSNEPKLLSKGNFKHMYWTMKQQLVHHTITGCNMRPGDLLGSGTISGQTEDSYGSLIELTWNGKNKITLPSGEERTFIENGDTIIMDAYCQGDGYRIGFGSCIGQIVE